jgi:hypothetical protein
MQLIFEEFPDTHLFPSGESEQKRTSFANALRTCGPQKFMQPWLSAHICEVILCMANY